ncbi:hypothetical protein B0H67DRAFT_1282 [Lasiosphaeris hirsuta]|uniref:Uncharacterized protein n=1 Tax=Lasiosphaeris hirsuta TaxID=260670 RepID=A0AA40B8B8_9PEZI|nr:hypothetical protein B0H67DRAFT_1282 [Lasiosphaeris hirsuta]
MRKDASMSWTWETPFKGHKRPFWWWKGLVSYELPYAMYAFRNTRNAVLMLQGLCRAATSPLGLGGRALSRDGYALTDKPRLNCTYRRVAVCTTKGQGETCLYRRYADKRPEESTVICCMGQIPDIATCIEYLRSTYRSTKRLCLQQGRLLSLPTTKCFPDQPSSTQNGASATGHAPCLELEEYHHGRCDRLPLPVTLCLAVAGAGQ